MNVRTAPVAWFTVYLATIPAANLAVEHWQQAPVGFGLTAPAGVYFVGIALVCRDLLRKTAGRAAVLVAMGIGVALSYWLADPRFATASAAAFAVSEVIDFFAYEGLRKRGLKVAMGVSNLFGLLADSVIFLLIAFGSLEFLAGQAFGKAWMTLAALTVIAAVEQRRAQAVTA